MFYVNVNADCLKNETGTWRTPRLAHCCQSPPRRRRQSESSWKRIWALPAPSGRHVGGHPSSHGCRSFPLDLCSSAWTGKADCPVWPAHQSNMKPQEFWRYFYLKERLFSVFSCNKLTSSPVCCLTSSRQHGVTLSTRNVLPFEKQVINEIVQRFQCSLRGTGNKLPFFHGFVRFSL